MRSRNRAIRLSVIAGPLLGLFLALAAAAPAHAFCIENASDTRLFFAVWVKGKRADGSVLSQWLGRGERKCQAPHAKTAVLEVFAFAGQDSLEGCDDEIAGDATLRLTAFEEFDNCIWKKPR